MRRIGFLGGGSRGTALGILCASNGHQIGRRFEKCNCALDGMGMGDSTKAALMTRRIAEITRLGTEMGGRPETFGGLSGIGDLIVTCTSTHSRNHNCGYLLGQELLERNKVSEYKDMTW